MEGSSDMAMQEFRISDAKGVTVRVIAHADIAEDENLTTALSSGDKAYTVLYFAQAKSGNGPENAGSFWLYDSSVVVRIEGEDEPAIHPGKLLNIV